MDWIETWFGVSPDGGNGVTEWLFVLAGVAVFVAIVPPFRRAALAGLRRLANSRPTTKSAHRSSRVGISAARTKRRYLGRDIPTISRKPAGS